MVCSFSLVGLEAYHVGNHLVILNLSGIEVEVYSLDLGEESAILGYSPDSKYLVIIQSGLLNIFDISTRKVIFKTTTKGIGRAYPFFYRIAFSPDLKIFAFQVFNYTVDKNGRGDPNQTGSSANFVNLETGKLIYSIDTSATLEASVIGDNGNFGFSPSGRLFLLGFDILGIK